jgi:hypothetical protein
MHHGEQERREALRQFQRKADRISVFILSTDYPRVDIAIEIEKLREECRRLYPESLDLFEMIYQSRFARLWEQFREAGDPPGGPGRSH